jgi:hypothetical protein
MGNRTSRRSGREDRTNNAAAGSRFGLRVGIQRPGLRAARGAFTGGKFCVKERTAHPLGQLEEASLSDTLRVYAKLVGSTDPRKTFSPLSLHVKRNKSGQARAA